VWQAILEHRDRLGSTGELEVRRREQARAWMWTLVEEGLREAFRADPEVAARIPALEIEVEELKATPFAAAQALLAIFSRG
jgi:LAO/AO transport system kinase